MSDAAMDHAYAAFCVRCGDMVGMSMEYPGSHRGNDAFMRDELKAGRDVQRVTVERTRREIVAACRCETSPPSAA